MLVPLGPRRTPRQAHARCTAGPASWQVVVALRGPLRRGGGAAAAGPCSGHWHGGVHGLQVLPQARHKWLRQGRAEAEAGAISLGCSAGAGSTRGTSPIGHGRRSSHRPRSMQPGPAPRTLPCSCTMAEAVSMCTQSSSAPVLVAGQQGQGGVLSMRAPRRRQAPKAGCTSGGAAASRPKNNGWTTHQLEACTTASRMHSSPQRPELAGRQPRGAQALEQLAVRPAVAVVDARLCGRRQGGARRQAPSSTAGE